MNMVDIDSSIKAITQSKLLHNLSTRDWINLFSIMTLAHS
jgi:hypothetical protein